MITLTQRLQALVVDIIRSLWHNGRYRNNKWLQQIHDEWFQAWVDVKTAITMADLDQQVEDLFYEWEDDDLWDFLDEQVGDTPLGGELRVTHRSVKRDD